MSRITDCTSHRGLSSTLISLLVVAIYTAVWSYFLIIQMETFNVGIFDYGVSYNLVWREAYMVSSYPSSVGYLPLYYTTKLISFLLVPYIWAFPSTYSLLILQSFIIAFSGFLLYLLANKLLKKPYMALLVQVAWVLYYPNSAANGYPFHYMTLFPLFYILGFYLFFKGKLGWAALSFSLSVMTDLLSPVIILLSIPVLLYSVKSFFGKISYKRRTILLFMGVLITFSVAILLVNYIVSGPAIYTGNVVSTTSEGTFLNVILTRLTATRVVNGLLYIFFLTFPLLFSVFIEYRFILPAIPSFLYYLVGYSGLVRFYYPMQYSSLASPILFIALIFVILRLIRFQRKATGLKEKWRGLIKSKRLVAFALVFVVLNASLFFIYSPISPGNQLMKTDFNNNPPANGGYGWYGSLSVSSYDQNLGHMISLVPNKASVLSGFNMPQFANRYYFTYPGQYNPANPIDYALNDPMSPWFTVSVRDTGSDFYNYNMMQLSNMFLQNSSYGVYAEAGGAILFKHDYTGNPVYYVPLNIGIPVRHTTANSYSTPNSLISPGIYNLNITSKGSMNGTLHFGNILISDLTGNSENVQFKVPLYVFSSFSLTLDSGNVMTIDLNESSPAVTIGSGYSYSAPTNVHTFQSNYTHFSNLISRISVKPDSFYYAYLINLTSYEDGYRVPVKLGNDSQVFSIDGKYPYVWNQVENTGKFEFGFRTENASFNIYLEDFNIVPEKWTYVVVTFNSGYAQIFVNSVIVFSGQIFPKGVQVGSGNILMIGGMHPFLHYNKTYPNSNPLNASIADFVISNATISYQATQSPQALLDQLGSNSGTAFADWVNGSGK
ncbi:putative membrane protein [Thermoplasmatales archaeon]|nr:putative membrane protein [Thermoplasmatales archaeon]